MPFALNRSRRRHERAAPWQELSELEEYEALCRARLEHLVEVREPLVLVSQIQRAGGTLLSQLFDGHPECHAHPHELKIGHPREHDWPPLAGADPDRWFELLFEKRAARHFVHGYDKSAKRRHAYDVFPFLFLPRLQRAIFDACVAAWQVETERGVLDCYFTSYFNAWLDDENLYTGPKRAVTGFAPRLAMETGNVERFFDAYPDGTLVSIVREPCAWFLSASSYAPEHYADLDVALDLWRRSTQGALQALERYGERVLLITYEQLVRDTETTMRLLAERIGIAFSPTLLEPSFNGRPIRANSSDAVARYGVLAERVDAYRDVLDPQTIDRIEGLAGRLYDRASAAGGPAGAGGG